MTEYDTFDERTFFPFVDNPSITFVKDAEAVKEEYKETSAVFSKMEMLKKSYSHFRKVRADGNCYYRALGYAYIEKLLTLGAGFVKDFRDRVIKQDGYYKCDDAGIVRILGGHLQQLHDRLVREGPEKALKLLFRMMLFSEHFDRAVITFIRKILSAFMLANRSVSINGLPLHMGITNEFASVEEFVINTVSAPNEEASLLVLVLAPALLRVSVDIALFDSSTQHKFCSQHYPANGPISSTKVFDSLNLEAQTITLLFKPGHYDILYSKEYLKKYPQLLSYDVEFQPIFDPNSMPVAAESANFAPTFAAVPKANSLYPTFDDFDSSAFQPVVAPPAAPPLMEPPYQPPLQPELPAMENLHISEPYQPYPYDPAYYNSSGDGYQGGYPEYPLDPYNAPQREESKKPNEFQCLLCGTLIAAKDMMVLNCLHKFHLGCLQAAQLMVCPVPGCGQPLNVEDKLSKSAPPGIIQCIICRNTIADVKKGAAVHCTRGTAKMHKECFIWELGTVTEGKILLTKSEDHKYHRVCPGCHEHVNEDSIKKNMDSDSFKKYKAGRDERGKEEKKKLEEEKRAKIKTKCCSKELNKRDFVEIIGSQNLVNILGLSVIEYPNPWICPLCHKAIPKPTLKEIYGQESGLLLLKKYCAACGRSLAPGEMAATLKCTHNLCPHCAAASFPCGLCLKMK